MYKTETQMYKTERQMYKTERQMNKTERQATACFSQQASSVPDILETFLQFQKLLFLALDRCEVGKKPQYVHTSNDNSFLQIISTRGWIFKIASSFPSCRVQVKKEHKSHLNNERLRTTMVVTSTRLSSSEFFCWRFVVLFPLGKCIFKKYLRSKGSVFSRARHLIPCASTPKEQVIGRGTQQQHLTSKDTKIDTNYLQPVDVGSSGIIPVLHGLRTMVVVTSTWLSKSKILCWEFVIRRTVYLIALHLIHLIWYCKTSLSPIYPGLFWYIR